MSRKENAAARPLFSADSAQSEEPRPSSASLGEEPWASPSRNAFTPIPVAERLRQPARHRSPHAQASLPPMRPGQRYGYLNADSQSAGPLPSAPISYPAPPSFLGPMEQREEDLLQYQQEYWSRLQNQGEEAPPPVEAEVSFSLPPVPSYAMEQPPWPMGPRTVWDDDFLEPLGEEEPGEWPPDPWEPPAVGPEPWQPEEAGYAAFGEGEPEESLWFPQEQWTPPAFATGQWAAQPPARPQIAPKEQAVPLPQRVRAVWKRWLQQNFPVGQSPQMNRARLFQTVLVSLVSLVLIFCLIQVGRLVVSLLRNDEEMKAVREEYYAQAGVDLARSASRVELLPPGQTYTPTATPQAAETPPPAPGPMENPAGLSVQAAGQEEQPASPQESSALEGSQRTKAFQYPQNPLNNISEAFGALRQENPDIVGRLVINGLVDETVVLRNNTYYLTHSASGAFSQTGAVFVDEACGLKSPPENLLLRGQSATPGKLLEPLWNYAKQGAEFVRKNAILRMDTLYEEGEYVVFAVIVASSQPGSPEYFNYAGYPSFPSDGQMESYVASAKQRSLYDIPVEVKAADRLLTLSTLGGGPEGATLVLIARKLRQGETAANLLLTLTSIRVK